MSYTDYFNTVQELYIAFYQRPADPDGLIYWAQRLDEAHGDLNAIINAFADSQEAQNLYGPINDQTIGNVIDAIYEAAFDRAPDEAGKEYYIKGFEEGKFTPATILVNILDGAQGNDKIVLDNKITAAMEFTKAIDPNLDGHDLLAHYDNPDEARDYLKTVGVLASTVPTEQDAIKFIQEHIAQPTDPIMSEYSSGQVYNLTTGVDTILGTPGDDKIISMSDGGTPTLTAGDVVDGAAGNDTLQVINENVLSAATIKNIETIELSADNGTTFNAGGVEVSPDGTKIVADNNSNVTVNNVNSLNIGYGLNGQASMTVNINPTLTQGDSDSINLSVENALSNYNDTFTTSNIEKLNITSDGSIDNTLTVNDSSLNTLTLNGSANLNLTDGTGNSFANVTSIDASQMTGGLNATFTGSEVSHVPVDFVFGSGNDTITINNLSTNDVVDFGAGTDTLVLNNQSIDTEYSNIKNLEQLKLTNIVSNITINAADIEGVNKVIIDGSSSSTLSSVEVDNVKDVAFTALDLSPVKINPGELNATLNISVDNSDGNPTSTSESINSIQTYNTSTLNLESNNSLNVNNYQNIINDLNTTAATLNISGNAALDINVNNSASLSTIDASNLNAGLTLDAENGINKTITTTAFDDSVTLGSADNTVNLGDGNDTVNISLANLTSNDHIDFGAGTDTINLETGDIDFTNNTDTNSDGIADNVEKFTNVSNVEQLGVDVASTGKGIQLSDAILDKFNKNMTITLLDKDVGVIINADAKDAAGNAAVTETDAVVTAKLDQYDNNGVMATATSNMTYTGGVNIDHVYTGSGSDTFYFTDATLSSSDIVQAGAGTDTFNLGIAPGKSITAEQLQGIHDVETFNFSDDASTTSSTDTIAVTVDNDFALNNSTIGASGYNPITINMTAPNATFDASQVTVPVGFDVTGSDGNDTIKTGAGADTINMTSGNDTINTGAGNDTLIYNAVTTGNSTIDMGDGVDTVKFAGNAESYNITGTTISNFENLAIGNNTVTMDASNLSGKAILIETSTTTPGHLVLEGLTAGADTNDNIDLTHLTGDQTVTLADGTTVNTAIGQNITVDAGAGDDVINASGIAMANGTTLTLNGGDGNDTITAADNNTVINGGSGDNLIHLGEGNDTVVANAFEGTDQITDFTSTKDQIDVQFTKNVTNGSATKALTGTKIELVTKSKAVVSVTIPAALSKATYQQAIQLTSKEVINAKNLTSLKSDIKSIAKTNVSKAFVLAYTSSKHKLYALDLIDTKAATSKVGTKIAATHTIATLTASHHTLAASDIHIF